MAIIGVEELRDRFVQFMVGKAPVKIEGDTYWMPTISDFRHHFLVKEAMLTKVGDWEYRLHVDFTYMNWSMDICSHAEHDALMRGWMYICQLNHYPAMYKWVP